MPHAAILIFLKYMFGYRVCSVQCVLTSVSFLFENATPSKKWSRSEEGTVLCGSHIRLRGNASWEQTHLSTREIAVGENQSNQSSSLLV